MMELLRLLQTARNLGLEQVEGESDEEFLRRARQLVDSAAHENTAQRLVPGDFATGEVVDEVRVRYFAEWPDGRRSTAVRAQVEAHGKLWEEEGCKIITQVVRRKAPVYGTLEDVEE